MSVSMGHVMTAKLEYVSPHARLSLPTLPHTRVIVEIVYNTISPSATHRLDSLNTAACRRRFVVIQCAMWAENPSNLDSMIVAQVSAARQGFKQLGIRLTMAVSVVSVWFLAAYYPWLRLWSLSKLANLSASMPVLQGEACSFSALCRQMSTCPKIAGPVVLFLATLAAALASAHCCGSVQGCHRTSDAVSRHDTGTCTPVNPMSTADLQLRE